jgi:hypothetical protein
LFNSIRRLFPKAIPVADDLAGGDSFPGAPSKMALGESWGRSGSGGNNAAFRHEPYLGLQPADFHRLDLESGLFDPSRVRRRPPDEERGPVSRQPSRRPGCRHTPRRQAAATCPTVARRLQSACGMDRCHDHRGHRPRAARADAGLAGRSQRPGLYRRHAQPACDAFRICERSISDSTHITSPYNDYDLVFENILCATRNETLELQVDAGGGPETTGYLSTALVTGAASGVSNATTFVMLSGNKRRAKFGCGIFRSDDHIQCAIGDRAQRYLSPEWRR